VFAGFGYKTTLLFSFPSTLVITSSPITKVFSAENTEPAKPLSIA
jgi:hypothetical protein